jgi:heparanase 1
MFGRGDEPISMSLVWTQESYTVSEDYLGVAIDAAMVTDGEWWENSDSPPRPLDFHDAQLRRWSLLLKPDWVRLGGTEADKLWLIEPDDKRPSAPLLHRPLFEDYLEFTKSINAKPFITVNAGPLTRKNNVWQADQFARLLTWLPKDFNGHLELGNEPGAHWLIFGRQHQIGFDQLAQEYQQARQLANDQNILLAGPANAFWPEIGEPLKQVFGSSKDFLQAGAQPDIFTWHYYPTQSSRCGVKTEGADWESLLDVETLQEFEKRNRIIREWLADYSPNSVQWLGETGPAQCGGKAKLTDRFGASLWWLSHLGLAAQGGNKTVIRQSLVGGDYALLRYNQGYSPNPDFWASVLWQQNMGAKGFRVAETKGLIRAFAHCHRFKPDTMSMVIINLSSQPATLDLPQAKSFEFIDVTSHELTSRFTFVEQQLADVLDWETPKALPWQPKSAWRAMPAYSYRWVNIDDVHQCGDSSGSSI